MIVVFQLIGLCALVKMLGKLSIRLMEIEKCWDSQKNILKKLSTETESYYDYLIYVQGMTRNEILDLHAILLTVGEQLRLMKDEINKLAINLRRTDINTEMNLAPTDLATGEPQNKSFDEKTETFDAERRKQIAEKYNVQLRDPPARNPKDPRTSPPNLMEYIKPNVPLKTNTKVSARVPDETVHIKIFDTSIPSVEPTPSDITSEKKSIKKKYKERIKNKFEKIKQNMKKNWYKVNKKGDDGRCKRRRG